MKAQDYYNESTGEVKVGKIFWKVVLAIIIIGAVSIGIKVIFFPAKVATEVIEKTFNADNIIFNYEQFHDQYESIKAQARKIKNYESQKTAILQTLPDDKKEWSYTDQQSIQNINTAILGVENILEDQISSYNANARKINRKLFKEKDLPSKLGREGSKILDLSADREIEAETEY